MNYDASIFNKVKTDSEKDNLLFEIENEHYLIQREIELTDKRFDLADMFDSHANEATLRAYFFHECKIRKIPIALEVSTKYGRLDAIIQINENFIIIELKKFHSEYDINSCKDQLLRYLQHDYPIIVISEIHSIPNILIALQRAKLDKNIYRYNVKNNKFKVIHTE